jgi:hypothetical protein
MVTEFHIIDLISRLRVNNTSMEQLYRIILVIQATQQQANEVK